MRKPIVVLPLLVVGLVAAMLATPARAASAYTVTLSSSDTRIHHSEKVTFSGRVSPDASGKQIRIQFYDTGQGGPKWTTWRTGTVRSNGTYSHKFTPNGGQRRWRVVTPSGSGRAAGISRSITIHSYFWYKVADLGLLSGHIVIASGEDHLNALGPIDVAGRTEDQYYASELDGSGTTRWYTQRFCKRLRVEVGLADSSEDGATAQFRVFAGAKKIVSTRVRKGTRTALDVPFSESGTPWIKFTSENLVDVPTRLVASEPRLHCSFLDDLG